MKTVGNGEDERLLQNEDIEICGAFKAVYSTGSDPNTNFAHEPFASILLAADLT